MSFFNNLFGKKAPTKVHTVTLTNDSVKPVQVFDTKEPSNKPNDVPPKVIQGTTKGNTSSTYDNNIKKNDERYENIQKNEQAQQSASYSKEQQAFIKRIQEKESSIQNTIGEIGNRSNPNQFPLKMCYPDYFSQDLQFNYISSDIHQKLNDFFKNNRISKEEQKNQFLNLKQEANFYKKLIPLKEQEKQQIQSEIEDMKQRSMIGQDNELQLEMEELERLRQQAKQSNFQEYQRIQQQKQSQYVMQPNPTIVRNAPSQNYQDSYYLNQSYNNQQDVL